MKEKKVFGLIGNPISKSLSPLMHNAALSYLKIKADYRLFPLKEDELKTFLASLAKKNIRGLNVTIPYKETLFKYAKGKANSAVLSIGAANTLVADKNGSLKFFNTDYLGFLRHIRELKLTPRKVAVIGAGGAAKAICFALGRKKAKEVAVFDIDYYRSLALIKKFNYIFTSTQFKSVVDVDGLDLKNKDLLINASPVGMLPDDPLIVNAKMLHPRIFIYDLIYNPPETKLLKLARELNLQHSNGLGMLLYQGAESLNLWIRPRKAPVKVMADALGKYCKREVKK